MTEEFHVRLSQTDADMIRQLVDSGVFSTLAEAVRFGVKQALQLRRFASVVEPKLNESDRLALEAPLQFRQASRVEASRSVKALSGAALAEPRNSELDEVLVIIEALRMRIEELEQLAERATGVLAKYKEEADEEQLMVRKYLPGLSFEQEPSKR